MRKGSTSHNANRHSSFVIRHFLIAFLLLTPLATPAPQEKARTQEEGVFQIFFEGKEIGSEKYRLVTDQTSAVSNSVLDFRNPANARQRIQLESRLEMDGRFRPRKYLLNSQVDGKKGSIVGSFPPDTAMFEYGKNGVMKKSGLMVGNDYTILDTNIFHHFTFLARLYNFDSRVSPQRFEVVIPQEGEAGFLKISELKRETLMLKGKNIETRLLQVESGVVTIHVWIDERRTVHRIAVPSSKIEVMRI
jgi:hypothetical protein